MLSVILLSGDSCSRINHICFKRQSTCKGEYAPGWEIFTKAWFEVGLTVGRQLFQPVVKLKDDL